MYRLLQSLCPNDFELYVLTPRRSRKTFQGKCVWTAYYQIRNGSIAGKDAFLKASKQFLDDIPYRSKVIEYGRYGGPDFGIFVQYGNKQCNCVQDFRLDLTRFQTGLRTKLKLDKIQQPHVIFFLNRGEYENGVNNFSLEDQLQDEFAREDRFVVVEYAIDAIKLGTTAIGVRTSQAVTIAVVKCVTSPHVGKIIEVDKHWFVFDETSVESCAQAASGLAIQFDNLADNGANAGILFAGIDAGDPQLWHMDPLGTYIQYDANIIGSGSESAQQILQESNTPNMTIKEAVMLSLRTLKQVLEEKLNSTNVEVMIVTPQQLFELYAKAKLQTIIEDLI